MAQGCRLHCQLKRVLHARADSQVCYRSPANRAPYRAGIKVSCYPPSLNCNASWFYLLTEWISLLANVSISKNPDYCRKHSFISCACWHCIQNTELLFDYAGHWRRVNRASFQSFSCIFTIFSVGHLEPSVRNGRMMAFRVHFLHLGDFEDA